LYTSVKKQKYPEGGTVMNAHIIGTHAHTAKHIPTQKKCEVLLAAVIIARVIFARKLAAVSLRNVLRGVILGVLFTCLLAFELFGLRLTDSGKTSFIENSAMIFVPLLQFVFFRKKPAKTDCIRIVLAIAGIATLTLAGAGGLLKSGSLFLLCAAVFYALAIMATSVFSKESDPFALGMIQVGTIGVLSLILSIFTEQPHLPQSGPEWAMILALAIICSGFGFTLQPVAQRGTTAERAGMMCAISPMSAAILGIIFLGEQISPAKAIGCALIMMSIIAEPLIALLKKHFRSDMVREEGR